MISLKINGKQVFVPRGSSVLEACKQVGIDIPRFCYHENLSVAGNCRMCLVEIEKSPKPVASCAMPVANNMVIYTETPLIKKARENVLEIMLLNHPLDCPICDQAGECDLQDQTRIYGGDYSRFYTLKRTVEDKNLGPLIKTIMTRCIHCTRCVRFATEIAGIDTIGTLNRGGSTEIGAYIDKLFQTEISGNVVDLCPVGALTSKPYAFVSRPWELRRVPSIDPLDSTGSNISIEFKETEIVRILPRFSNTINNEWISDKIRYSFDSLRRFRITKIYEKTIKNFTSRSWDIFFISLKKMLNTKKTLILIQPNIDAKSLFLLDAVNRFLNFKVRTIGSKISFKNHLHPTNSFNDLQKTDACILLGTNIKIENPILQIRLRENFLKGNFFVTSVGTPFSNTMSTKFLNLSPLFLLKVFAGKSFLQQIISCCNKPAFFFGKSVLRRFSFDNIFFNLKSLNKNGLCFYTDISPNMRAFEFFNFPTLNNKDICWAENIFFMNVEETYKIRTLVTNINKNYIWANTHGSILAEKSNYIIPLTTFFESIYYFVNAEGRLQKTLTAIKGTDEMLSSWEFAKMLIPSNVVVKQISFNLFKNAYKDPSLFAHFKFNSNFFFKHLVQKMTNYPLKSNIEDYHLSNKISRASGIMGKCSQAFRAKQTNFVKI